MSIRQEGGLIFVVGQPRSGTKLLRRLLNGHPKICLPPEETQFLPALIRTAATRGVVDWSIIRTSTFAWNMEKSHGRRLPELEVETSVEAAFRSVLSWACDDQSCRLLGDKTPDYVFHMDLIHQAIPNSCFIHLRRDPRAVSHSAHKAWGRSYWRTAADWSRGEEIVRDFESRHPNRIYSLGYEGLVNEPLETLGGVWDFIGVEELGSLASFDRPIEAVGGARGARQIEKGRTDAFHAEVTPHVLRRVEEICFQPMCEADYRPTYARRSWKPPKAALSMLRMRDAVRRVAAYCRQRGLTAGLRYALRGAIMRRREGP